MFQVNLFLRRLSCVDQVQVDMLCQAHADKLVTISPKIKNLHSHLVNDLVIVSYQKHWGTFLNWFYGQDFWLAKSFTRERHLFGVNLKTHFSPGPVYFVKDEITRFGKDGTAKYTQQGRRKEINSFKPPGPGRYENHKCHPQGKKFWKNSPYSRKVFVGPHLAPSNGALFYVLF